MGQTKQVGARNKPSETNGANLGRNQITRCNTYQMELACSMYTRGSASLDHIASPVSHRTHHSDPKGSLDRVELTGLGQLPHNLDTGTWNRKQSASSTRTA